MTAIEVPSSQIPDRAPRKHYVVGPELRPLRLQVVERKGLVPLPDTLVDLKGELIRVPTVVNYSLVDVGTNYARNTEAGRNVIAMSDKLMRLVQTMKTNKSEGRVGDYEVTKQQRDNYLRESYTQIPLLAWIASHRSSWEVMEAITTSASALHKDAPNTAVLDSEGRVNPDWLSFHPQAKSLKKCTPEELISLRDLKLGPEVAVFDTWGPAVGVAERARHFQDFYEQSLKKLMFDRIDTGSREPIIAVDFAAGSYKYAIRAAKAVFDDNPSFRDIFGDGESRDGTPKIPLKMIPLDVSYGALQYINALVASAELSEYIEPAYADLSNPADPFINNRHPFLTPDTKVDIATSVGLVDYMNGGSEDGRKYVRGSKAEYVTVMRQYLKSGGLYCNANIAKLGVMPGTNYTGQEVLNAWFKWYPMFEATPEEFILDHLKGYTDKTDTYHTGWNSQEISRLMILPSCIGPSGEYDQSFFCLEGVKLNN